MADRSPSTLLADTQPLAEGEGTLDSGFIERAAGGPLVRARWRVGRSRLLAVIALAACLAVFFLARLTAQAPGVPGLWRVDALGRIALVSSTDPALRNVDGLPVLGLRDAQGVLVAVDHLLQHSSRWVVRDSDRAQQQVQQHALEGALHSGRVALQFEDAEVSAAPSPRGLAGLGAMFWLMSLLALVLFQAGMVALLAAPSLRGALYALVTSAQAGNLLLIGLESVPGLGLVPGVSDPGGLRAALDILSVAAIAHATGLHPRLVPSRHGTALAVWAIAGALLLLMLGGRLPQAWWWTQAAMLLFGLVSVAQLAWSYRLRPHPLAAVLSRFALVAVVTLLLLTTAAATAGRLPVSPYQVSAVGAPVWHVFFASLVMLVPLLSRSQQVVREFALLAGISTAATSLDLLFVSYFSLEQFTSLTLSLFAGLGLYAAARQWLMRQMLGTDRLTIERTFEHLYRIAREVETQPRKLPDQLSLLLRQLFEPLEVLQLDRPAGLARVVGEGAGLLVPMPRLADTDASEVQAIVLRFANRGRRVFTVDDARLAGRIVEQLERAVAYERAVERGRSEERVRIAQDLHDDIGARLLTLMYRSPSREMEDYLRHTLQDLKTLSRGLAASGHRLSHATAEWKSDIAQRLAAAHCELGWSFAFDRDAALSAVEWSGLTRVLRELVSNAIAHAHATRVDVELVYEEGRLTLTVTDNGSGRAPQDWSHGLGLGGVRKRTKQLGGDVVWRENGALGIQCRVELPRLGRPLPSPAAQH